MARELIEVTEDGLWCGAGGFHIDPWRPVERAVITHAHADHARSGSAHYLTSEDGAPVLRARLGESIDVETLAYGETRTIGDARVSLHPAGHLLGSCMVRVEADGYPTWLVTGDYKLAPDATCRRWEPVPTDVLLTESTFGLPIYRWRDQREVFDEINDWWRSNAGAGRTSVVLAYSLGKAQRVLSGLDASIGPIGTHGAVERLNDVYRAGGIDLPPTVHANADSAKSLKGVGMIVAPPSAAGGSWLRRFAGEGGIATSMASGWMAVRGRRRWRALDRGFVLSDHADWDGLNEAVRLTGATRVGVTHGYAQAYARWLTERGLDSFVVPTRYEGERVDEDDGDQP